MLDVKKFANELSALDEALKASKRVLITAPGAADGDSIGAQLALRQMIGARHPQVEIHIINDEVLPPRYHFLPNSQYAETPEVFWASGASDAFDVAICVDGGIDRAGRVRKMYEAAKTHVFIDHHSVSCEFPYKIRLVEASAAATTELIYHISQTDYFKTELNSDFAQYIYLGLVFDTCFFRHANTTPEVMELAARLLRTGFDFTRVGERGMLERTFGSLRLLAETLRQTKTMAHGKIIWSVITKEMLREFRAIEDDREGIIDHLFLTQDAQVAVLFFELDGGETKVSFRSQGLVDVAHFARNLTVRGGGHAKAAGANLALKVEEAENKVLKELEAHLVLKESLK